MLNEHRARVELAHELAQVSGEVIRSHFRCPHLDSTTKTNSTSPIVTIADESAERAMRELIVQRFPDDGIIGEELGNIESKSGFWWVLDPIDGTSSFVRGFPIFGTLIACIELKSATEVSIIVGVLNQPVLGETFIGVVNEPSVMIDNSGRRTMTAGYADTNLTLADVCLTSTTPFMFVSEQEQAGAKALQRVCKRKAFGGDCYSYGMLAAGKTAMPLIILESDMKFYDWCALVPIIEGAGGVITDWSGEPLTPDSTQILGAPSRHLLNLAVAVLQSCR